MSGGLIAEVQPDLVVKDDVSSHGSSPPLHCDGWTPLDGDLDTRRHGDGKIVKLRKTSFSKKYIVIIHHHSCSISYILLQYSHIFPQYWHQSILSLQGDFVFKETLSGPIFWIHPLSCNTRVHDLPFWSAKSLLPLGRVALWLPWSADLRSHPHRYPKSTRPLASRRHPERCADLQNNTRTLSAQLDTSYTRKHAHMIWKHLPTLFA